MTFKKFLLLLKFSYILPNMSIKIKRFARLVFDVIQSSVHKTALTTHTMCGDLRFYKLVSHRHCLMSPDVPTALWDCDVYPTLSPASRRPDLEMNRHEKMDVWNEWEVIFCRAGPSALVLRRGGRVLQCSCCSRPPFEAGSTSDVGQTAQLSWLLAFCL